MTDSRQAVSKLLSILRPHSKFVAVSHSSEFIDEEAQLGEGFYYASVYDEAIDANLNKTRHGNVLFENTYIVSFAYNLFVCWLYGAREGVSREQLDSLLVHNLKKLCAEQLYRTINVVAARALLLETLLFEQVRMVSVFDARQADPELFERADTGSNIMSFALQQHEFAHYLSSTKPHLWAQFLEQDSDYFAALFANIDARYPAARATESRCDVFAVYSCIRQYGSTRGLLFALRSIAFAYAAYAAIYSVTATAKKTAGAWPGDIDEEIDFRDIERHPHRTFTVEFALDEDFAERAALVLQVCERLAQNANLELYGDEKLLPLPRTVMADLVGLIPRIFDCDDDNARKMSHLVAQAFHNHEEGMEFLYLRSKTFRTAREGPLKL